jgi:hypothetical protein
MAAMRGRRVRRFGIRIKVGNGKWLGKRRVDVEARQLRIGRLLRY